MSTIIEISDAVVAKLNAGPFSIPFQAERHYKPTFDLVEMKDLRVTVVPRGVELSGASRSTAQTDVQIDIGIQRKLPADAANDAAEIDALMRLVEEIADFFRTHRLSACPNVSWVRTENRPIYSPEHIEQLRQFTSVLTLTFRALR